MATPTTEPPPQPPQPSYLPLNSIPFIDMTTLTQSELHSLSLISSSSSLNPNQTVTNPPITVDRTSFNESAGSRRQTYSRPSSHQHHRHRLAGLLPKTPNPNPTENPTSNDTDRVENHAIIKFLKQLLSTHSEFSQLDLVDFDSFTHLNDAINFNRNPNDSTNVNSNINSNFNSEIRTRKRGRKPKIKVISIEEQEREIVNKNGVVIDLVKLAGFAEDPYKEELKRRTEGMGSEEELLEFFRNLNGQWCSRRRKRRIVDANDFGDFLPVGWKLLFGLKRKEGKTWAYCRRYLSPSGEQFLSCKEVSAYLQSFFTPFNAQQVTGRASDNIPQVHRVASENQAGYYGKEEDQRHSGENEKAVALLGVENLELAEVQIQDLFECHKCNMTFDEKDTYLQHLLSFHQRTTRRFRLGSSVGDGVIVKDGKYECQFCHKVFHERRRYNGHVGIHVRNYVRGIEESPSSRMALQKNSESPTEDELPTRISKMDALIEIAQNSIRETSSDPNGEPSSVFTYDKQTVDPDQEPLASVSDHELKSDSTLSEPGIEYAMIDETQELELFQQKPDDIVSDEKTEKLNDAGNIMNIMVDSSAKKKLGAPSDAFGGTDCPLVCTDDIGQSVIEQETGFAFHGFDPLSYPKVCTTGSNMLLIGEDEDYQDKCKTDEVGKTRSIEIEFGFGSNDDIQDIVIVQNTDHQSMNGDELQHDITESPASLLQISHGLSARNVENDFSTTDQRHDRISGFEELRLEDIEQLKFSFGTGQEPNSEAEVPLNLENNTEMAEAYGALVQFESEVIGDTADGQQLTVCVWCGVEFIHEAVDTEIQSNSVGYMCSTCKARISGQLNAFGGNCS
ncbi:uncharacterized protein LOC126660687 [Mercurialis annua]|uniref:uncharacterized protein LOC126660687 n=1 Tax=Mercurialis annua TaxID=3986 RepID=UPI00215F35B4|nr:uncharacterized protein LOC126660687 [Mercurialis annua]XP_050210256.1 uncharacterized protein LOC126660687 [Mercurialis annua]